MSNELWVRDQHGWSRKWRGGSWSGGHDQPQVSLQLMFVLMEEMWATTFSTCIFNMLAFFPPWSNPQCPSCAFYYLLTKNFSVWKSVIYRHINYGIEIKMNTVRICLKITYNSDVSIIFGSNYEVQHSPSKKLSLFDSF